MLKTTFLSAAIIAGLSGAAFAGCMGTSHETTAGSYTPAPVADAADTADTPVLLPAGQAATQTDEG